MKCEKCGKNEATVYIKNVINGKQSEMNLCSDCAEAMGVMQNMNPFSAMNDIWSGFFPEFGFGESAKLSAGVKCPVCGMPASEIARTGYMGCSECYKNFSSIISPVVRRIHGDAKHTGKVPGSAGSELAKKRRLAELKKELQESVKREEFERAAALRDEIRGIENGGAVNE